MHSLDDLLKSSDVVIRHRDEAEDARRMFLHAGRVFTAIESTEITTILGSCVAICIWDPLTGIGGMNHFMLPLDIGPETNTLRDATFATKLLLAADVRLPFRWPLRERSRHARKCLVPTAPARRSLTRLDGSPPDEQPVTRVHGA